MRDFHSDDYGPFHDEDRRDVGEELPMNIDEFVKGLQELARRAAEEQKR